jgi:hypothetical protein
MCCKTFNYITILMLKYNTCRFHISSYFNTSTSVPLFVLVLIHMTVDSAFSLCPSLYSQGIALVILIILFGRNHLICYYILLYYYIVLSLFHWMN